MPRSISEQQLGDGREAAFGVTHRRAESPSREPKLPCHPPAGSAARNPGPPGPSRRQTLESPWGGICRSRRRPPGPTDVLGARREAHLVHREEDAALHRLEAVLHLGQGTGFDHAHRVGQIGALGVEVEGRASSLPSSGVTGGAGLATAGCVGGRRAVRRRDPGCRSCGAVLAAGTGPPGLLAPSGRDKGRKNTTGTADSNR